MTQLQANIHRAPTTLRLKKSSTFLKQTSYPSIIGAQLERIFSAQRSGWIFSTHKTGSLSLLTDFSCGVLQKKFFILPPLGYISRSMRGDIEKERTDINFSRTFDMYFYGPPLLHQSDESQVTLTFLIPRTTPPLCFAVLCLCIAPHYLLPLVHCTAAFSFTHRPIPCLAICHQYPINLIPIT